MISIRDTHHCEGIADALERANQEDGRHRVDVSEAANSVILISAVNRTGKVLAMWEVFPDGFVRLPEWRPKP